MLEPLTDTQTGYAKLMPAVEPYRNRALILALTLLLTLQASEVGGWRPMLFFAHIGAVLLWQPLVPHKRSLTAFQLALVAGIGALLAALLSPWVLLGWATLLTGLAAGRITMLAPRRRACARSAAPAW